MIVTARQLEDLHKSSGSNGHVTLPYRARLSPMASDWIKSRKIQVGYSDTPLASAPAPPASNNSAPPLAVSQSPSAGAATGATLWWCDGPCGPAKAAVAAYAREVDLRPLEQPNDAKQLVGVIKTIANEIKAGRAARAVLLVQSGAMATVYANRCPSLRAVLSTCLEAVEQGIQQVSANVLVIEYPHQTLQQMKNLLARFTRGGRALPEDVARQLQELSSCG